MTLGWHREGYARWLVPETWVLRDSMGAIFARVRRDHDGWRAHVMTEAGTLQSGPLPFQQACTRARARVEACPRPLN
jgi:hypothetical protein